MFLDMCGMINELSLDPKQWGLKKYCENSMILKIWIALYNVV